MALHRLTKRDLAIGAVLACWFLVAGIGFAGLIRYQTRPGQDAAPDTVWPAASEIPREAGRATLLLFAHPHCPCTRATLGELARVMRHGRGRVHAEVLFIQPSRFEDDWVTTDLWRRAAAIPGVRPHRDPDGREAHRFRVYTSGSVLLYDADGRLQFNGGITPTRGHEGDNEGRYALLAWIDDRPAGRAQTAVFGCPLHDEAGARCTGDFCRAAP